MKLRVYEIETTVKGTEDLTLVAAEPEAPQVAGEPAEAPTEPKLVLLAPIRLRIDNLTEPSGIERGDIVELGIRPARKQSTNGQ